MSLTSRLFPFLRRVTFLEQKRKLFAALSFNEIVVRVTRYDSCCFSCTFLSKTLGEKGPLAYPMYTHGNNARATGNGRCVWEDRYGKRVRERKKIPKRHTPRPVDCLVGKQKPDATGLPSSLFRFRRVSAERHVFVLASENI